MEKVKVKVCGIQEPEDALVAAQAGADYLGMVFVPGRRRRIGDERGRLIASTFREQLETPPKVVGLFADQPLEEVNGIVAACGLDMVQVCGRESLDYCGAVNVPVIKVLHVDDIQDVDGLVECLSRELLPFREAAHIITLDRKVEGLQGGTGKSFNWDIARGVADRGLAFILAGGLTPDNVAAAVRRVRPWGVDVSSGVETPGVPGKDHDKTRAFIRAARSG